MCNKSIWIRILENDLAKTVKQQTNQETTTSYTVKRPLSKRPKIVFQDQLSLNAGQKYWRILQGEYSAILPIFIKLPFVIKIFVIPRRSRRDIVLASSVRPSVCPSVRPSIPSVRPSVRNHISVPIGQIWFILGTNDKYHGPSNIQ